MASSDSSDSSGSTAWVPYTERERYADVTPVAQADGAHDVVAIQYTARFRATMDVFRAFLAADELSARSLHVAKAAVWANPANYTAWYFRRRALRKLDSRRRWRRELRLVSEVALENPKNYQHWQHRQVVLEALGDEVNVKSELGFIDVMLSDDAKNYHAWAYRQWLVKQYDIALDAELAYTETMLKRDIRNNSAWSFRRWLLRDELANEAVRAREVRFALERIAVAQHNESAWNYLGSLPPSDADVAAVRALRERDPACPFPVIYLVRHGPPADVPELCALLASRLDRTRQRYWRFRGSQAAR